MSDVSPEPSESISSTKKLLGDFAPKLVSLTDDVLFADIWERAELSPRDRSLATVASLITAGNVAQLPFHLNKARENGLTAAELIETVIHLAFYAGWPRAMSAIVVARDVLGADTDAPTPANPDVAD